MWRSEVMVRGQLFLEQCDAFAIVAALGAQVCVRVCVYMFVWWITLMLCLQNLVQFDDVSRV
jgi:hypothetical protein